MKNISIGAILAVFGAATGLRAQAPETSAFTEPSGYETISLQPGFNLIGMRFVEYTVARGDFTSHTATSLTDANATFALNANTLYLVEFGGSTSVQGLIIEAMGSSFSGGTLTGLTNISADYRTTYTIRPAKTISQLFGSGENVILKKGTVGTADVLHVPNAAGTGLDVFYHTADSQPFPGAPITIGKWFKFGSSEDQSAAPINYMDSFYVQIRGAQKSLVVSGQVKTTATLLPGIQGRHSFFSSVYPAGTTLATSGIADQIQKGTLGTADLIYMPNQSGGFDTFYHSPDSYPFPGAPLTIGQWQKFGFPGNYATTPFTSGFILLRRGASSNVSFDPPTFYSGL